MRNSSESVSKHTAENRERKRKYNAIIAAVNSPDIKLKLIDAQANIKVKMVNQAIGLVEVAKGKTIEYTPDHYFTVQLLIELYSERIEYYKNTVDHYKKDLRRISQISYGYDKEQKLSLVKAEKNNNVKNASSYNPDEVIKHAKNVRYLARKSGMYTDETYQATEMLVEMYEEKLSDCERGLELNKDEELDIINNIPEKEFSRISSLVHSVAEPNKNPTLSIITNLPENKFKPTPSPASAKPINIGRGIRRINSVPNLDIKPNSAAHTRRIVSGSDFKKYAAAEKLSPTILKVMSLSFDLMMPRSPRINPASGNSKQR